MSMTSSEKNPFVAPNSRQEVQTPTDAELAAWLDAEDEQWHVEFAARMEQLVNVGLIG